MHVERAFKNITLSPPFNSTSLKVEKRKGQSKEPCSLLAQNYLNLFFYSFLFLKDQLAKSHTTLTLFFLSKESFWKSASNFVTLRLVMGPVDKFST